MWIFQSDNKVTGTTVFSLNDKSVFHLLTMFILGRLSTGEQFKWNVKCDKKPGRRTDLSIKRHKQFVFGSTLTWENCENGGSKLLWCFGGLYVAFVNVAWIKPRKASPRVWEERLSEYAFAKIYRAAWSGSHNKLSRQVVTGREEFSRKS